jgi:hypothetical protein
MTSQTTYASPLNGLELERADDHLDFQVLRGKIQSTKVSTRKLRNKYVKIYRHTFYITQS